MMMEQRLTSLFDFQRFAQNPVLQSMIDRSESCYGIFELADDDLANLAAAGDPALSSNSLRQEDKHL